MKTKSPLDTFINKYCGDREMKTVERRVRQADKQISKLQSEKSKKYKSWK